uniref:Uncharacterized protein n=1 Tax=Oryza rufipogon TaxID=4529 RepID=A0A0E0PG38_ORYRU
MLLLPRVAMTTAPGRKATSMRSIRRNSRWNHIRNVRDISVKYPAYPKRIRVRASIRYGYVTFVPFPGNTGCWCGAEVEAEAGAWSNKVSVVIVEGHDKIRVIEMHRWSEYEIMPRHIVMYKPLAYC